jgi:hypothetical protein
MEVFQVDDTPIGYSLAELKRSTFSFNEELDEVDIIAYVSEEDVD